MAQKTEKEETEFKAVPKTLTLCVNNCGVTGNPSTNNMCQKCFSSSSSSSSTTSSSSLIQTPLKFSTKSPRPVSFSPPELPDSSGGEFKSPDPTVTEEGRSKLTPAATMKRVVNRCSGCKRKVGLTGFRCRCGELFCSEHRYTDRHDCNYDYKAAGREAIARENPVVKAAKIIKV